MPPQSISKRGIQLALATLLGTLTVLAALGLLGLAAYQARHHPVQWLTSQEQ